MSDQSNCPDFVPFDSAGTPLSARKISTGCGLHLPGSPPGICAAWRLSGAGSSVSGWSPNPPAAPQTVHLVSAVGTFRTLKRRSSSSHKCSIGLRSGLSDDQGRVQMF